MYETHFDGRSGVAAAGNYLALAEEAAGDAIVRAEARLDETGGWSQPI